MFTNDEEINVVEQIFRNSGINCLTMLDLNLQTNKTDIDVLGIINNIIILVECVGKDNVGPKSKKAITDFNLIENSFDEVVSIIKGENAKFYRENKKSLESENKIFAKLIVNFCNETKLGLEKSLKTMLGQKNIQIWTLEEKHYFNRISECTFGHCKYEILNSLKVNPDQVENSDKNPKVYLANGTKVKNDLFVLNLIIPVNELLRLSAILRLNNTENEEGYQRLLDKKKLIKMRKYLLSDKNTYYPNNIIAVLNSDCELNSNIVKKFEAKSSANNPKISRYFNHNFFSLTLPDTFNCFEIIDGQHRLFSYSQTSYSENSTLNASEKLKETKRDRELKTKAENTCLNVTAIYSKTIKPNDKYRLFYEINTTQTRIKPEDIIDLAEKFERNKPEAQASMLLRKLNSKGILSNKIKIYYWQDSKIKRTSLIKYSGLTDIFREDIDNKSNLIFRKAFENQNVIPNYLDYCYIVINNFIESFINLVKKKYSSAYSNMINDLTGKKYYLFSAVFIGALVRLSRHFLSSKDKEFGIYDKINSLLVSKRVPNRTNLNIVNKDIMKIFEPGLKEIVSNLDFTRSEFDNKKSWGFNKWSIIEKDLFNIIRKRYSKFGQANLIIRK